MHLSNFFTHWSEHLRRYSNDASLVFDQDGNLSLLVDKHRIDCQIMPDSLILRTRICNMPQPAAEQYAWLCRVLMLTNTHAHNRSEFPVLTTQCTLQLHVWLHTGADHEEFCMVFDQFIDALTAWRHALQPLNALAELALNLPLSHLNGKPFGHLLATALPAISKGIP